MGGDIGYSDTLKTVEAEKEKNCEVNGMKQTK
jgi:hypothetical protein